MKQSSLIWLLCLFPVLLQNDKKDSLKDCPTMLVGISRELLFTPPTPERGDLGSLVRIRIPQNQSLPYQRCG